MVVATGTDTCMVGTTIGSGWKIEGVAALVVVEVGMVEASGSVETNRGGGGRNAPFLRGIGRLGLTALPIVLPTPGNLATLSAEADSKTFWLVS